MPQNKAQILWNLLSESKRQGIKQTPLRIWAEIFGIEPRFEQVAPMLIELSLQLDAIEQEVREKFTPEKASTALEFFPQLRMAILFQDIRAESFERVYATLTPEALYSLKMLIHDIDDEPDLKANDIEAINASLSELFRMVERSDINKKLRTWILNWLSMIRNAIDRYRITGPRGLQDALIRIQGEADFFWPAFKEVEENEPTVCQNLLGLFDKVCKVSDMGERVRKMFDSPIAGHVGEFIFRRLGG